MTWKVSALLTAKIDSANRKQLYFRLVGYPDSIFQN
jgi:hypothetical protein